MPDRLGIETLSSVIVEAADIVKNVRDSLPKIDLGDLSRLFAIFKSGKTLVFTDWRQVVSEGRDLDPDETKMLGELVAYKLSEQGIIVENGAVVVEKILNVLDSVIELVEILPKKPKDSTEG